MLFFITGCSFNDIKDLSIDESLNIGLIGDNDLINTYNKGFKYYMPKGFMIFKNNLYNQVLISNNNKYYLNVDIISYYNKISPTHTKKENTYYYKSFVEDKKEGYIEIFQNNDYFFIEIMYNYAIIEVAVKESEINYAVINMLKILSSIKFNDKIIENEIGSSIFTQKETVYELEKPKTEVDDRDFLDWVEEYDNYNSEVNNNNTNIKDEDKITD